MTRFKFWGAATIGTKGQIVIPADAREALSLKEGDKLLVVSTCDSNTLIVVRPDMLEEHLKSIQNSISDILNEQ